jgi:hypothetical protein
MRAKMQFSRWVGAAAILAVAECCNVAAVHAQSSSDFFRFSSSHLRPDRHGGSWFTPPNWERKRKPHRQIDNADSSIRRKMKSRSVEKEPIASKKETAESKAIVENVPLPRPRPPAWAEPRSFAEAAGPGFDSANVTSASSDCDQRLTAIAAVELLPRLIGPGDCGGRDMIELGAIMLPNHRRIEVRPAAILRCEMAESLAAWIRDEASDHVTTLGDALRAVDSLGSYECRGRNGAADAKLSEHGKGNAIDIRALVLAGGRRIDLTDDTASKPLRDDLRDSACHRFSTVLGPGADNHHENHIHLDILQRHRGARICQWDVREPPPPPAKIAHTRVRLAATTGLAQPRLPESHAVNVGPWAIAPNYKANKLESCTMSRSDGDLAITFARASDGLLVILESQKWKLNRGKTYPVRLSAGSRSVNAKALAEAKSVSISLADTGLITKLRSVNRFEVRAEGATLRVPLDGSSAAFARLDECFDRRDAPETNPFEKRGASEKNPFVAPGRKH